MAQLVAKRYAKALFDIVVESGQVDLFQADIHLIVNAFEEEIELRQLLSNPKINFDQKVELLESVFKGRVQDDLVGLLILLIRKGRNQLITEVLEDCLALIQEYKGIKTAYITLSQVLTEEQQMDIIQRLEALTKSSIQPIIKIDPAIIGGMIIRIGDRVVDNSVYSKIQQLAKNLKEIQLAE